MVGTDWDPILADAQLVSVECPGVDLALRPHEARALAVALLEHAAVAERPVVAADAWLSGATC